MTRRLFNITHTMLIVQLPITKNRKQENVNPITTRKVSRKRLRNKREVRIRRQL